MTSAVLAAMVMLFAACDTVVGTGDVERGSGTLVTEPTDVGPFHRLSVAHGLAIEVTPGPDRALTVTADDNLIDHIVTRMVGDELRIASSRDIAPSGGTVIRVSVPVPELVAVRASDGARVTVNPIYGVTFAIDASGGSRVTVSGDADRVAISAGGGSVVLAGELIARELSVSASGGSRIEVHARERVTGDASEGSTIVIAGDPPVVEVETSGGAQVRRR